MAMLRHRDRVGSDVPVRLILSARSPSDVLYADELMRLGSTAGIEVVQTFTREPPPGWTGRTGRIDAAALEMIGWPASERPRIFVCGPTGFVEAAADALSGLGHEPGLIRTERFGATGG
jgi:ferredoxin-NADP reductase